MRSIKKRLLSLLLTLITILGLLPTSALAASGTGKGITITKDQAYWSTRLLANGTPYSYRPPMAMSMIFNVVLLPKCGGTYNQAFLSAACNMTLLAAGIGTALVCLGVSAYDKPETFVGTKKSEPLKMSDIVEVLKHNKPLQCYIASNASDKLAQ